MEANCTEFVCLNLHISLACQSSEYISHKALLVFAALCDNQVHLNDPVVQAVTFRPGKPSMLAEFASIQLEFKTLSHYVKDPKYAEKADNMIKPLHAAFPDVVSCFS